MPDVKTYRIVALHDRPDLVDHCATLLNQEWKRSHGMRARSLLKSNDDFPCNLAMLENIDRSEKVVGHVRLTRVAGKPTSLYLSSVIIEENQRGTGLGRKILELTEEFIKPSFDTLFLRTKSTPFYVKCGYVDCDPVQEYTSKAMEEKINQLQERLNGVSNSCEGKCASPCAKTDRKHNDAPTTNSVPAVKLDQKTDQIKDLPPPPPIPPPPRCAPASVWDDDHDCECNFWMKKVIISS